MNVTVPLVDASAREVLASEFQTQSSVSLHECGSLRITAECIGSLLASDLSHLEDEIEDCSAHATWSKATTAWRKR